MQFILRSPLLLSSVVPADFAEQLRRPYTPEELQNAMPQDSIPRLLHRLSSVSNGSELSFRNSARDSDSEGPNDWGTHNDVVMDTLASGSGMLRANPQSSFEEMMERAKIRRERTDGKNAEVLLVKQEDEAVRVKTESLPGCENTIVTLML